MEIGLILILGALPAFLQAQADPAEKIVLSWYQEHGGSNDASRAQALLESSAAWVAQWPDSRMAWEARRNAVLFTHSSSAELWKQVDENLIRLSAPHAYAGSAAYDWVTAHVNLNEARDLINSEIQWIEENPTSLAPSPTLTDTIDEHEFRFRIFPLLCTLASAQIQLRDFPGARAAIVRIRTWLDTDFKRYYDQDPFETFPDEQSKYFTLSAQLAEAEGRNADAIAFYQRVITNPYFRREYGGFVKDTHALWGKIGGTEEGWSSFSKVPPLPAGVPSGYSGMSFGAWLALDYKLPSTNLPGADSRIWTNKDFEGKTT